MEKGGAKSAGNGEYSRSTSAHTTLFLIHGVRPAVTFCDFLKRVPECSTAVLTRVTRTLNFSRLCRLVDGLLHERESLKKQQSVLQDENASLKKQLDVLLDTLCIIAPLTSLEELQCVSCLQSLCEQQRSPQSSGEHDLMHTDSNALHELTAPAVSHRRCCADQRGRAIGVLQGQHHARDAHGRHHRGH